MKLHELKLDEHAFTPLARGAKHHLFLKPTKTIEIGHLIAITETDEGQRTGRERLFWVTSVETEEEALKPGYASVSVLMVRRPRSI